MSDRLAVLEAGRILQIGSPRDVYGKPRNRFVANFIGRSNILEGQVSGGQFHMAESEIVLPLKTGEGQAAVALRAEDITIHADLSASLPNAVQLAGNIEDAMFLGEGTEFRVRCGRHLLKVMDFRREAKGFHVGQPVRLSFSAEDVAILDE